MPLFSLVSLMTSSLPLSPRQYSSSPIVITTLKILTQFRKRFNLSAASSLTPIHNSHLFLPSRLDHAFNLWLENGIINIGQLYIGGVFGSSGDVFVKYNIPRNQLFRYFQVRQFAKSLNPSFPNLPQESLYETILD